MQYTGRKIETHLFGWKTKILSRKKQEEIQQFLIIYTIKCFLGGGHNMCWANNNDLLFIS